MCAAESDDLPSFDLGNYLRQNIYHRINVDFPGLQLVHEEPYIFLVNNFASVEECRLLTSLHESSNAQPSATGPGQEALRTSTSVFPAETSIRWLRERIAALTNVQLGQLEPTKISMYAKGQYFKKHTDASFLNEKLFAYSARLAEVDEDGVQAPCSWPSRFCTCFIYLNDCASGGRTRFGWLDGAETMPGAGIFEQCINALRSSHQSDGRPATNAATRKELSIPPRTGLAVVHFPTTDLQMGGCVPDPRTMHESETAVDPKCIIQQFIWPCEIDAYAPDLHEDVRREWLGIQASAQGTPSS